MLEKIVIYIYLYVLMYIHVCVQETQTGGVYVGPAPVEI